MMGVVDALERTDGGRGISYTEVVRDTATRGGDDKTKKVEEDEEDVADTVKTETKCTNKIVLPGAADGTNAREIISAARKHNILITAFHPELTDDYRWHSYFHRMVVESMSV